LAAVLLVGTFELHAPGEGLESFGHQEGETYSSSARHPNQPAHFEPSQDEKRPACPACLHQQRTSGAHLLPLAVLAQLTQRDVKVADLASPRGHLARSLAGARAPPAV
jgi:hypothetical protein